MKTTILYLICTTETFWSLWEFYVTSHSISFPDVPFCINLSNFPTRLLYLYKRGREGNKKQLRGWSTLCKLQLKNSAVIWCFGRILQIDRKIYQGWYDLCMNSIMHKSWYLNFLKDLLKFDSYLRKGRSFAWTSFPTSLHQVQQLWMCIFRNIWPKALAL